MTPSLHYYSKQKRVFDVMVSLLLIIISSPLLISISLLILISVGQPIIFSQLRLGKNKRTFTILKFRTMYIQAEKDRAKYSRLNEAPSPMFKASNDPRFVGIGRLLSRSGLDELPQLFNILTGDMSFVGPRPLPVAEAKKLSSDWNFRYTVLPGVFSEWSLSPDRHTSLKKWKELEIQTLSIRSISGEINLIFRNLKHHLGYLLLNER